MTRAGILLDDGGSGRSSSNSWATDRQNPKISKPEKSRQKGCCCWIACLMFLHSHSLDDLRVDSRARPVLAAPAIRFRRSWSTSTSTTAEMNGLSIYTQQCIFRRSTVNSQIQTKHKQAQNRREVRLYCLGRGPCSVVSGSSSRPWRGYK